MGISLDTIMMASAIASISDGIPARRVVTCGNGSIATPHGTAAALKAEAPQRAYGPDTAPVSWWHVIQRAARKAANRRKARRGWR